MDFHILDGASVFKMVQKIINACQPTLTFVVDAEHTTENSFKCIGEIPKTKEIIKKAGFVVYIIIGGLLSNSSEFTREFLLRFYYSHHNPFTNIFYFLTFILN